MTEYGIYDTKINRLIRKGFTENQANSFMSVHLADNKKPWLKIMTRVIGEWQ